MCQLLPCCYLALEDPGEMDIVQLSTEDANKVGQPVLLTRHHSFDVTMTPNATFHGNKPKNVANTCQQQSFTDQIKLPTMRRYPIPPNCTPNDPEKSLRTELLRMYKEFVLDMHKGIYMTQLLPNQEYNDIHCQIVDNMQSLMIDQGCGSIIEFPLSAVSNVFRAVKNDDRMCNAGSSVGPTPLPPLPLSNAEHVVIVEFLRRRLAFVFSETAVAQRFLVCMELVILRARELSTKVSGDDLNVVSGSIYPSLNGLCSTYKRSHCFDSRSAASC